MFGNVIRLLYESVCTGLNLSESFVCSNHRNWANCFPTEVFLLPLILRHEQLDMERLYGATPPLHRETFIDGDRRVCGAAANDYSSDMYA